MHIRNRLTGIETNLDDLQAGVDAGLREIGHIHETAASIDRLRHRTLASTDLVGTLVWHAHELEACVRDQRGALQELRAGMARLRDELIGSTAAVTPPTATAADRQRR